MPFSKPCAALLNFPPQQMEIILDRRVTASDMREAAAIAAKLRTIRDMGIEAEAGTIRQRSEPGFMLGGGETVLKNWGGRITGIAWYGAVMAQQAGFEVRCFRHIIF